MSERRRHPVSYSKEPADSRAFTDRFDRISDDIFALQDEITKSIFKEHNISASDNLPVH